MRRCSTTAENPHSRLVFSRSPIFSWCKLGHIIFLSVLMCTLCQPNCALAPSEEAALRQILKNHPDLTSVPSWEILDSTNQFNGMSWNDSFANLCQSDGFDYYGVYCLNGHVAGLKEYVHLFVVHQMNLSDISFRSGVRTIYWGKSLEGEFSASGLNFLTNLYVPLDIVALSINERV